MGHTRKIVDSCQRDQRQLGGSKPAGTWNPVGESLRHQQQEGEVPHRTWPLRDPVRVSLVPTSMHDLWTSHIDDDESPK